MSDSENSSSGSNFLANFINGGVDSFYNYVDSWTGDFFNKRSEKRAYERALRMLQNNYNYAKRYSENSPKWAVDGLRAAGLNPILAAGGGVHVGTPPSAPSVTPTSVGRGNRSGRYWDPLLNKQIESVTLDNKLKKDTLKTVKVENEVKRLKAEAEADLLRPWTSSAIEGDGKSVSVQIPSESFKTLQKAIADDYDLRSEKYVRETIDAVMKYGLDVLELLSVGRKKEILHKLIKIENPSGKGGSKPYTQNKPERVFQYD